MHGLRALDERTRLIDGDDHFENIQAEFFHFAQEI
jgi:hypothetical protein